MNRAMATPATRPPGDTSPGWLTDSLLVCDPTAGASAGPHRQRVTGGTSDQRMGSNRSVGENFEGQAPAATSGGHQGEP